MSGIVGYLNLLEPDCCSYSKPLTKNFSDPTKPVQLKGD